jgi:diphthamide synthase
LRRDLDARLVVQLPVGIDACGENGEFYTFVYDGPMFRKAIPIECGEIVTREGFVFADVSEATLPSQPGCTMPSAWELNMEIPADNVSSGRDWGRRLLLDYVEYSMGYTAARQRMPRKKVKPYGFNYEGWERGSLIARIYDSIPIKCARCGALIRKVSNLAQ